MENKRDDTRRDVKRQWESMSSWLNFQNKYNILNSLNNMDNLTISIYERTGVRHTIRPLREV